MNDNIKYYIAGIIDGEGTITLSSENPKTKKMRIPVVSVSSTTLPLLDFLKLHYGGSISKHKVYQSHHKQSWSWKVRYNGAIKLCSDVVDILIEPEKRRRADLLINVYPKVTKRNGKYTEEELISKKEFEEIFLFGDQ